jgi:hypothetical protein
MLATTPPPVKPQSRVYAVLPATGVSAHIAAGRRRKMSSMSGVMIVEALKSECDGELGASPLQRRMAVERLPRAQPIVCTF